MSKMSPLGQSMAALFSSETAKLRSAQKTKENSEKFSATKVPGNQQIKSEKPGDSLGNPSSPGYESWNFKSKEMAAQEEKKKNEAQGGAPIEITEFGPQFIRLSLGWEKILLAQKKLCEKAKNLFTAMDAPDSYQANRRGKNKLKSVGCIVDLDIEAHRQEQEAKLKNKKDDNAA